MVDYYMLSPRYWVIGSSTGFNLYYYATQNKTLILRVRSDNGDILKDNVGNNVERQAIVFAGTNNIDLADWLSAVNRTWNEGVYLLEITDGQITMIAPFFIFESTITLDIEEPDKIEKIIIYDTVSTIMIEVPKTTQVRPLSTRWKTIVYQHNDNTKMGRLVVYYGFGREVDTKWARNAVVEIALKFSDLNSMVAYLAKVAYVSNSSPSVVDAIGRLLNTNPSKVVSILGLYGVIPFFNARILDYSVDVSTYTIKVKELVRLGFGWNNIVDALKWAGIVMAGTAVLAGGVALTVGTGGLGGVVSVSLIAGGVTFVVATLYGLFFGSSDNNGSNIEDLKDKVKDTGEKGRQNIQQQGNNALTDLDTLYQQGQITETAYNILKQDIQAIVDTAVTAIDEVVNEASKSIDEAYKRGYEQAKKDMMIWLAVAGVGGFALGAMVSK